MTSEPTSSFEQIAAELREKQRFIEHIADTAPYMIYVYDIIQQHNVYANRYLDNYFGRERGASHERGLSQIQLEDVHPDDLNRLMAMFGPLATAKDDEVINEDIRLRHHSGAWRTFRLAVVVFKRDASGNVTQVLSLGEDIEGTVQARQRELELVVERERVSLLERLISDLSHDLKTPVSILYTSTYLLDKLTDRLLRQLLDASAKPLSLELLKDAQQTALSIRNRSDTLKANSERLQKLVDALFDLALLDSRAPFAFETHDLHPILQNLAESHKPVAEDHGLSFSFQAQDLPPLSIDASQVQRSVIKLLENAIQFTPSGGKVALRASSTPDAVLIEVSDTGIGMTPGEQARIFERFYRADPARQMETGGLGLGLNIVQKIVEAHRGSISVESAPEEGSRFIIRLPRTEQR